MLDRDGWRCQLCGRAGRLEVDHIIRMAQDGAAWDAANLQTLCRRCHILKSNTEGTYYKRRPEMRRKWALLVRDLL